MVNQNKIFSFKIKRQVKNVFPRDVERTIVDTASVWIVIAFVWACARTEIKWNNNFDSFALLNLIQSNKCLHRKNKMVEHWSHERSCVKILKYILIYWTLIFQIWIIHIKTSKLSPLFTIWRKCCRQKEPGNSVSGSNVWASHVKLTVVRIRPCLARSTC